MLKKICLLFTILIFTLFFVNKAQALTGNGFIWNKTEISVALNDNFESYLDEFEVTFYYKGQIKDDVDVKVELDDMYYHDYTVSTKEVGQKTVKLIATVSGYSSYDKKDILVHIEDKEPPVITLTQPLIISLNAIVNYEEYFIFTDNDAILSYVFNDKSVNYTKIGVYPLTVIVIDKNNNKVEQKYSVSIVDNDVPTLETVGFIEVKYGDEDFDITNYVTASDNLDGNITNQVKCLGLNVYKLGPQIVTITVEDSNHNIATVQKEITVTDQEAPELELSTYYLTIGIGEKPDFKSYITKAYDECDGNLIDLVEIDDDDFKIDFGSYDILYTLEDNAGNKSERILEVMVSYSDKPVIEATDLEFEQNEVFDLNDYIKVTDKYDNNVSYKIYDDILDNTKPGTYEIIITALNKAGQQSSKTIYVKIKSNKNESIKLLQNIYDYIYENKLTIAIIVICSTGGIIYYIKNKKVTKSGE